MKEIIKNNLKYLLFLIICGLVGGYFTAIYTIQSLSQDIIDEAIAQIGSVEILIAITTIQSLGYAVILGIIGKIIAKKIGLWRKIEFSKRAIIDTLLISIFGGIAFILADHLIFNNFSDVIKNSYALKPTIEYIIASILYGGVIEEIMLRLFTISLLALIVQKLAKKDSMDDKSLIIANLVAAVLFAIGHLPATILTIGISPMILIRCFVMNGGFSLMFGYLYRKHGIHCSMIAHAGVHIISKIIWILFI